MPTASTVTLLFGFTNLQLNVDTSDSTHIQNNVVLLGDLKTRSFSLNTVLADYKTWHGVLASLIANDMANSGRLVVRDGDLAGMTDPEGSVTVPTMVASCAEAWNEKASARMHNMSS